MAPTSIIFNALPATHALELVKAKNDSRRGSLNSVDSKLSCDLATLNLEEPSNAFPCILWDANEDSDSESIRSLDSWNSFIGGDSSGNNSVSDMLGNKRSRSNCRRLVRSKKIKSDLSSLARCMATRSA